MKQEMTKDEARVERSIRSIMGKIELSMARTAPLLIESEREFERQCLADGLIYFPRYGRAGLLYPSI